MESEAPKLPPEEFINTALKIVEEAEKEGITLRIMGALAIRLHLSPQGVEIHKKLKRLGVQEFTDIDLVGFSKQRKQIRKFFESRGWRFDSYIFFFTMGTTVRNRQIYRGKIDIDVFLDELDMCHKIDFRKRLTIDYPTISLADLLLEKLQIVEFSEKDAKDLIALIRDHKIGGSDASETINAKYIAELLADDWGFWYTATTNLKRLKDACPSYAELTEEDVKDVVSKIDEVLKYIDAEPKTKKWQKRAKIGTKKRWYKEVRLY